MNRFSRSRLAATALAFALALAGALWLHAGSTLYDTDAYYHLAVARAYAEEGLFDDLRWTRFSIMADGFGDKELLFHLLLAPLAGGGDPLAGGRLALALLTALLAAAVTFVAHRSVGPWALLVPFWLIFASTELGWRLVRLRPELLACVLVLVTLWAVAEGHDRLVGLLMALFTLAYTAFHALLGVVGIYFFYSGWTHRRWRWPLLLYSVAGAAGGLVLHPHFPKNLEVWLIQNVQLFIERGGLNIGTELRPNFTDVTLMVHLGWLAGLVTLWRSRVRDTRPVQETDRRLAEALGIAAVVFGVLYLLMSRFSLYAVPLVTLWLLAEIRRRGERLGRWTALPGRGRMPLIAAFAVCLLLSWPEARRQLATYHERTDPGPGAARLADREALARALPEGARVVADWGATATYMLWAPQGRYLNALDPVFMAVPYPERYRVLRDIFEGREPDVPLAAALALDSEYFADSLVTGHPRLTARLMTDPRVEILHRRFHGLFRFHTGRNDAFVLDWKIAPPGVVPPVAASAEMAEWPTYPRLEPPRGRELEGYVDLRRLGDVESCVALVSQVEVPQRSRMEYELAPYGPAELWIDGELVLRVESESGAILGRATIVPRTLATGGHRLTVATCPAADGFGFYLLRRRAVHMP